MKTSHLTAESIFHAFLELTDREKKKFTEKIQALFSRENKSNLKDKKKKDKWSELEKIISPMRRGLPVGYKFDREEANAR